MNTILSTSRKRSRPFTLDRIALLVCIMVLALCHPAWATNYVMRAPSVVVNFIDRVGATHTPDANGHVTITDVNLIPNFLSAGFVLKHTPSTASHSYGAAHADWTLTTSDNAADLLSVTSADQAVNIIATPTAGKMFLVVNGSGQNVTIKATGQTGVTVANGASVHVRGTGTDFAAAGLSAASAASSTAAGIVELAIDSEAIAKTDATRVVTPANLAALGASATFAGLVELAIDAEAVTGSDTARAVTPANLTARMAAPGAIGGTTPAAGTFTTAAFGALTAAAHDYAAGNADWTISAAEARAGSFATTNAAGGAANAILPAGFLKLFHVNNTSGQNVVFKYTASTGVTIATAKQAVLFGDGTEIKTVVAAY